MKVKKLAPWFILAGILTLSACSSTPEKDGEGSESSQEKSSENNGQSGSEDGQGVEVIGVDGKAEAGGSDIKDGENIEGNEGNVSELGKTIEPLIFFGFDQFDVDDAGMEVVKYYAAILVDNPSEKVKLIGHTDERGTPEYNLALGEKRAKAVEEAFMLYGVSSSRMEVITMGEEQPFVDGHYEAAWTKNRRVEVEIK